MDLGTLVGIVVGLCGILGAGVGIGLKVRRPAPVVPLSIVNDIEDIQQWREGLSSMLERKFVQRVELQGIRDSLERIERNQEALTKRFMDGAAG